jgi:hypothetical protein
VEILLEIHVASVAHNCSCGLQKQRGSPIESRWYGIGYIHDIPQQKHSCNSIKSLIERAQQEVQAQQVRPLLYLFTHCFFRKSVINIKRWH